MYFGWSRSRERQLLQSTMMRERSRNWVSIGAELIRATTSRCLVLPMQRLQKAALSTWRELAIKSQREENDQLLVSVSDTGVGLPPQQADQIFNAFFTTKPHGTGMGLRISRSIVESHGGRMWAADNPPRGASFHLTLPTKAEAHEEK